MATSKLTAPRRGVNPNLLDNWLFAGGGSQQGGGQFPINHRAQTSYPTGTTYCIDRWIHIYGTGGQTATQLQSDGILLSATGNSGYIRQRGVEWESYKGKTVTFSVLYKDGNTIKLATGSGTMDTAAPASGYTTIVGPLNSQITNGAGCGLYLYNDGTCYAQIGVTAGNSLKIIAAKVEIGDTQTLAHLENGVWTLNTVPNFQEEQLKCLTSKADASESSANRNIVTGTVSASDNPYIRFYQDDGSCYQLVFNASTSRLSFQQSTDGGSTWTTVAQYAPIT